MESLETYYARRAAEYEKIYHKPERQTDLARLRSELPALFDGERVLELACGTGYWTPLIAARAQSVVALDLNEETLQLARTKPNPKKNVTFQQGDAYALPTWPDKFSACFAGFWWSHVPLSRLDTFLDGLRAKLADGARVVFLDNRFVAGSSTPVSRRDAEGNGYQSRRLADGTTHEVLKNFPTAGQMEKRLGRHGTDVRFTNYQYYWVATYRIMSAGRT